MSNLTIYEGPDGSGKTTAAKSYAEATGALYIHHGPYQGEELIHEHYVRSMLFAAGGQRDVVMDRCWLSEPIYGAAFRDGQDRIGPGRARALERLAQCCAVVVVRCLPPWRTVVDNYVQRHGQGLEMLDKVEQLAEVYQGYQQLSTSLPMVDMDYTRRFGSAYAKGREKDDLRSKPLSLTDMFQGYLP